MVYYQNQTVFLLAQISTQVHSIAPQVSFPSTSLPPYPNFSPAQSDVRVNAFWFMSLVFSLTAALLATLVQQWVREYMHVFQRYSNPLKSARLRQYLYEGVEELWMPMVAESVPGLVHVSLFLFFVGICDSLLAINTTVAITTIVPISICGLLYVLSTFIPIINPKSPYQNPFSSAIWYVKQKAFPRRCSDRSSGGLKELSSEMSEGKAQLAMEENDERKDRDVRAVQWLIDNSTEDDEMESFALAIPGTFTSKWGVDVWRKVSQHKDTNSGPNVLTDANGLRPAHGSPPPPPQHPFHPRNLLRRVGRILRARAANGIPRDVAIPRAPGELPIDDLCKRVRHLLETCNNRGLFADTELWRKRARGCIETVASLVFCADVKLEVFGDREDLGRLLAELIKSEKTLGADGSAAGSDGSFVTRWTCLSLVVVTQGYDTIEDSASLAIDDLSRFQIEDDHIHTDEEAIESCRRIDNYFQAAREICVYRLRDVFSYGTTEEQVREVLTRDSQTIFSVFETVAPVVSQMEAIDRTAFEVNRLVNHGLKKHLPGVSFDVFEGADPIQPIQFYSLPVAGGQRFMPQFVFLGQRLRLLCSYTPKLRDIIDGRGHGVYEEVFQDLRTLWNDAELGRSVLGQKRLMERQLWRLLDLRDGGGFGLSVELFFLVLAKLLSMGPSQDKHAALYMGTFRYITSGWRQHKSSNGTYRVILNLICDITLYERGVFSDRPDFPSDITTELLLLLENITKWQSDLGQDIDDAMTQLNDAAVTLTFKDPPFFSKARALISRLSARAPS